MQENPFSTPQLGAYYGGYIPSPPDDRDFLFTTRATHQTETGVLKNHDLRDYKGQSLALPVRNQGQVGSCTGFAWTAVRGALAAKYHIDQGESPDLGDDISARFLYHKEREYIGTYPRDSGADMRTGAQVLLDIGCCPERYAPYNNSADDGAITEEMLDAAGYYGISGYQRCAGTGQALVNSIIAALDQNQPVAIALLVTQEFEYTPSTGLTVLPHANSQVLGGHANVVFGNFYDNAFPGGGALLVMNSWGEGWGQGGWYYMPYAYATVQTQYGPLLQEAWVAS